MDWDEQDKKATKRMGAFMTIPFVLGVPPIIGWLIGSFLDKLMGTDPYIMFFFLIVGFVAGFKEVYRIIKRYGDES